MRSLSIATEALSHLRTELPHPPSNRFVRNLDAEFGVELHDMPQTEIKSGVQPYCPLVDRRWKVVIAGVDGFHLIRLPVINVHLMRVCDNTKRT